MRVLVLVTGEYGRRHVENMQAHLPGDWQIDTWQTPRSLPLMMDYYDEWLPDSLDPADLILSLAELPGVAEFIPDLVKLSGARAVIAPIDSLVWLPLGLARQLVGWLARMDIPCLTPMPFCSLTETHTNHLRLRASYAEESGAGWDLIRAFAQHFGRPEFEVAVNQPGGTIVGVTTKRDACCGCARFVAERLVGTDTADALEAAGLHHHHYPCQASMGIDANYGDTLMHVSGNILKDALKEALGDNLVVDYLKPEGYTGDDDQPV